MPKFYFTYSPGGQPYAGGWTEIEAPDAKIACDIFRAFHPDKIPGILNCASVYTEAQFVKTVMLRDGNFGRRCVERFILFREELA